MKQLRKVAIAVALLTGLIAHSQAAVISNDGIWQEFSFGGVGSSWSDSFTLTLTGAAWLKVTDLYNSGDQFEVFLNSNSLGLTSAPASVGDQIGNNYDAAFSDSRWSSGQFLLAAGSYTITGKAILSPYGAGGAALQVAPVPEPETYALMGMGLLGLFAARRRKNQPR